MKKLVILSSILVLLTVSCSKGLLDLEEILSDQNQPLRVQTKITTNDCTEQSVTVEFTEHGVQITYRNFEVLCYIPNVNVNYNFANGVLTIRQWAVGHSLDTISTATCYAEVSYTIKGISKEQVNVIFINDARVYFNEKDGDGNKDGDKDKDGETTNFFDLDHRIGLWVNVNAVGWDSLIFVCSSKLIRSGGIPNKREECSYKIEGNILIINGSPYNPILRAEKNVVVLGKEDVPRWTFVKKY